MNRNRHASGKATSLSQPCEMPQSILPGRSYRPSHGAHVIELDSGHSPFFTQPAELQASSVRSPDTQASVRTSAEAPSLLGLTSVGSAHERESGAGLAFSVQPSGEAVPMKAAVIREVGALAEVDDVAEPAGETIEVLAAPVNPIDVAVSRGVLATGHPVLPYVPGCEAVGRTADGTIIWIFGGSLGRTSNGAMGERAAVGDAHSVEVPAGADAALAAGLGIAGLAGWLPFAWRAPLAGGEDVLVLGATGSVGLVAVQTAKLLGARRVVAAGRSAAGLERAADLGADATLRLDGGGDLVTVFKEAFDGDGPSYVFDALWGEPGAAAALAAAPKATIVNLGQSAGATAALFFGGGAFQEPVDPRLLRVRRPVRRPSRALLPSGCPRGGRGHPARRGAGTTRLRYGRMAASGRRRPDKARRRTVTAWSWLDFITSSSPGSGTFQNARPGEPVLVALA